VVEGGWIVVWVGVLSWEEVKGKEVSRRSMSQWKFWSVWAGLREARKPDSAGKGHAALR
jgi:hypothetical protein